MIKKIGIAVLALAVVCFSFSFVLADDQQAVPQARPMPPLPGKIGDTAKPQVPPAQNVIPDLKGLLMAPPKINIQGLHLDDKLVKLPLPTLYKNFAFYRGHWENVNANGLPIKYLYIGGSSSDNAVMRAWGACQPTPCDWGQVKASVHTSSVTGNSDMVALSVTAPFNHGFCQRFLVVEPSGANIKITLYSYNYTDGRKDTVFTATMKKLPF